MRKINKEGLELIKKFEAFCSKPYLCPAKIPTIGYGTTHYPNGMKVELTDKEISELDATTFLAYEIDERCAIIDAFLNKINLSLNDNQFSALISFAYNCGTGPIIKPGRSMNLALKKRDIHLIADTFLIYNKITKSVLGIKRKVELPGLTKRRKEERDLFLKT
jgi:lysozyme